VTEGRPAWMQKRRIPGEIFPQRPALSVALESLSLLMRLTGRNGSAPAADGGLKI